MNGSGWEREQSQAESWWQLLTSSITEKDVVEFSWKSRWWGHASIRLLKPGPYWVAMRLGDYWGDLFPRDFGIRKLNEVEFTVLPSGDARVRIGKRTFRATNMTPVNPVVT